MRQQLHGARGCVAELMFNSVVVSWTLDTDRETAALRNSAQQGKVCFRPEAESNTISNTATEAESNTISNTAKQCSVRECLFQMSLVDRACGVDAKHLLACSSRLHSAVLIRK